MTNGLTLNMTNGLTLMCTFWGLAGASCRVRGRGNGLIDGRGESRGRVQPLPGLRQLFPAPDFN